MPGLKWSAVHVENSQNQPATSIIASSMKPSHQYQMSACMKIFNCDVVHTKADKATPLKLFAQTQWFIHYLILQVKLKVYNQVQPSPKYLS